MQISINEPMKMLNIILIQVLAVCTVQSQTLKTEVLIVGGGASGVMAGIQASRMGVSTMIVEESEWLGGMLTAAGVSAIDGNHSMPSGLWGEFRQKLYDYYGGPKAVETGWVSNTLFEPSIGNNILKELAQQKQLTILYNTSYQHAEDIQTGWRVTVASGKKKKVIETKILIDATELGDVVADLKATYRIGMDSRTETGEPFAPPQSNDIIQDLTYVAILKDYGESTDKTIAKPEGYKKEEFHCACEGVKSADGKPSSHCLQMMRYGKLPNNKYMINWPKCGNDYYLNLIEKTPIEREALLKEAKLHTLRFLYYLQVELGFKNFGIADDEFPTADHLPIIPYYRESRRIKGVAELNVMHIARPFDQPEAYYRTGIAVGDYPIDHHHGKNADAPTIDFINIRVPSYNVPLGVLIPKNRDGLIVAEKSISVTNIVNGATRLQPVVMGIGQAAGALAAVCVTKNIQPRQVSVREVQQSLLHSKVYLMPYRDVNPADPGFEAIQRVGATGILKGIGIPYKWANQTWFYPHYPISEHDLVTGMLEYYPQLKDRPSSGVQLSLGFIMEIFKDLDTAVNDEKIQKEWGQLAIDKSFSKELLLNRGEAALLIDHFLHPFNRPVDFNGHFKTDTHGAAQVKPTDH
jgi:FAD dependent oxidoreductase